MSRPPSLGAHRHLRWPLTPLLDLVRLTPWAFAHTYGISGSVMRRALDEGLDDRYADQWATRAGYHPAQIWGPAWLTAGHLGTGTGTNTDHEHPARPPAATRHRGAPKRSTSHTTPATDEAMAS